MFAARPSCPLLWLVPDLFWVLRAGSGTWFPRATTSRLESLSLLSAWQQLVHTSNRQSKRDLWRNQPATCLLHFKMAIFVRATLAPVHPYEADPCTSTQLDCGSYLVRLFTQNPYNNNRELANNKRFKNQKKFEHQTGSALHRRNSYRHIAAFLMPASLSTPELPVVTQRQTTAAQRWSHPRSHAASCATTSPSFFVQSSKRNHRNNQ